jgi:hypothetical protein
MFWNEIDKSRSLLLVFILLLVFGKVSSS